MDKEKYPKKEHLITTKMEDFENYYTTDQKVCISSFRKWVKDQLEFTLKSNKTI
jgi:hypothetical protein